MKLLILAQLAKEGLHMMKRVFLLLSICCCVVCFGSPVKSMLGVEGTEIYSEETSFSASDYVQDGLVAMWDGIENAGWGLHDDMITCPFELVSEQDDVNMIGKFVASENCYVKPDNTSGTRSPILANSAANALNNGYCYIEVVSYINAAPGATYGNRFNLCGFTFGY